MDPEERQHADKLMSTIVQLIAQLNEAKAGASTCFDYWQFYYDKCWYVTAEVQYLLDAIKQRVTTETYQEILDLWDELVGNDSEIGMCFSSLHTDEGRQLNADVTR